MSDLDAALAANRAAIGELLASGDRCASAWTTPSAPGKWSPSQISEHVARALEESAHMMTGAPSKFPKLPRLLHPILRRLVFYRVVNGGSFPKGRTAKAMNPTAGSATPAEARQRFSSVLAAFDAASRQCAASGGTANSTIFGAVQVVDYVRFQERHVRHHIKQMPS
jgi:hypothetical protein